jgi:hypothetical protein
MIVKATREGLEGGQTSTGWPISNERAFVALPSVAVKKRWVRVRNPLNGKVIQAEVLDTGPWSEQDDEYVLRGARPLSESNQRKMYNQPIEAHTTNGAGIDLGQLVWDWLEMKDNTDVEWEFV